MPKTFLEAKQQVLRFAKRPSDDSDWLALAGDAINESMIQLQRKIPGLHALSKVGTFTYTEGSKLVTFKDSALDTEVNKIIGCEVVRSLADWTGTPMKCLTYRQLADERKDWYMNDSPGSSAEDYSKYVKEVFGHNLIILEGGVQVYPIPSQDINLAIFYTPWLPTLVDNNDSNVLIKYAWNYIFYSALAKMNLFLNEAERIAISQKFLETTLSEVIDWDTSLNFSQPIRL